MRDAFYFSFCEWPEWAMGAPVDGSHTHKLIRTLFSITLASKFLCRRNGISQFLAVLNTRYRFKLFQALFHWLYFSRFAFISSVLFLSTCYLYGFSDSERQPFGHTSGTYGRSYGPMVAHYIRIQHQHL